MTVVEEFTAELLEFVDTLRQEGYNLGTTQFIAVQDLLAALASRGALRPNLERLGSLVGPIVCNTPEQQDEFTQRFDAWLRDIGPRLKEGWVVPEVRRRSSEALTADLDDIQEKEVTTRRWLIGAAVVLVAVVGILWAQSGGVDTGPPTPVPDRVGIDTLTVAPTTVQIPWTLLLGLLGVAAVILAGWRIWVFVQTERFLKRRFTADQPEVTRILVEGTRDSLFGSHTLFRTAQRFRQHQALGARYLNTGETIRQSIEAGGYFTPAYSRRMVMPEYLALIDRSTFRDHQAHLVDNLLDWLVEHGVIVDRFYFDGDPRVCYPQQEGGRPLTLLDLSARFPEHRLMIFSDGEGLFHPFTGELESWAEQFSAWPLRAVLTFDPANQARRRRLAASDFYVRPASEEGLAALVDVELAERSVAGSQELPPGYPRLLRERPLRWLEDHEPDEDTVEDLLAALRTYLGDRGLFWLGGCAVYPELRWHLTLQLGRALPYNGGAVLDADTLAAMSRLPWFRYGRMPDWFRRRLLASMGRGKEEKVRAAIQALLITASEAPDDRDALEVARQYAMDMPQWGRRFIRRITGGADDESPLREHVFATFMTDRLAVRVPKTIRRMLQTGPRRDAAGAGVPVRVPAAQKLINQTMWLVGLVVASWLVGTACLVLVDWNDPSVPLVIGVMFGLALIPFPAAVALMPLSLAARNRAAAAIGLGVMLVLGLGYVRSVQIAETIGFDDGIPTDFWVLLSFSVAGVGIAALRSWVSRDQSSQVAVLGRAYDTANRLIVWMTITWISGAAAWAVFGAFNLIDQVSDFGAYSALFFMFALPFGLAGFGVAAIFLGRSSDHDGARRAGWLHLVSIIGVVVLILAAATVNPSDAPPLIIVAWPGVFSVWATIVGWRAYVPRAAGGGAAEVAGHQRDGAAMAARIQRWIRGAVLTTAVLPVVVVLAVLNSNDAPGQFLTGDALVGWAMLGLFLAGAVVLTLGGLLKHRMWLFGAGLVMYAGLVLGQVPASASFMQLRPWGVTGSAVALVILAGLGIPTWRWTPAVDAMVSRRLTAANRWLQIVTPGVVGLAFVLLVVELDLLAIPTLVTWIGTGFAASLLVITDLLGDRSARRLAWVHVAGWTGFLVIPLATRALASVGDGWLLLTLRLTPYGPAFGSSPSSGLSMTGLVLYTAVATVLTIRYRRGVAGMVDDPSLGGTEAASGETDPEADALAARRLTRVLQGAVVLTSLCLLAGLGMYLSRVDEETVAFGPFFALISGTAALVLTILTGRGRSTWLIVIGQLAVSLVGFVMTAYLGLREDDPNGLITFLIGGAAVGFPLVWLRRVSVTTAAVSAYVTDRCRRLAGASGVVLLVAPVWVLVRLNGIDEVEALVLGVAIGLAVVAGLSVGLVGWAGRIRPLRRVGVVYLGGLLGLAAIVMAFQSSAGLLVMAGVWLFGYWVAALRAHFRAARRPAPEPTVAEGTSRVFVSYAVKDRRAALMLMRALREQGIETWSSEEIRAGEDWQTLVDRQLNRATHVVLLLSEASVASRWEMEVAERAAGLGKLIPVRTGKVEVPVALGGKLQQLDLEDWTGDPTDPRFLQLVQAVAGGRAARGEDEPGASRERPAREDQDQWKSGWGFTAAVAGAAIGWADLWTLPGSLPFLGGQVYYLAFLVFFLILGVPLLSAEIGQGQRWRTAPVAALAGTRWSWAGTLFLVCAVGLLASSALPGGWLTNFALGLVTGVGFADPQSNLAAATSTSRALPGAALALFLAGLVVARGIRRGVEPFSKAAILVVIVGVVGLVGWSAILPGFGEGLQVLVQPDPSFGAPVTSVLANAARRALWTLTVGFGLIATYSSYLAPTETGRRAVTPVALAAVGLPFLGGVFVAATLATVELESVGDLTQLFVQLPTAATSVGTWTVLVFAVVLLLVWMTSTVGLLEVIVAALVDRRRWSRKRATWVVVVSVFGLAVVNGLGAELVRGFNLAVSNVLLPVAGIVMVLIVRRDLSPTGQSGPEEGAAPSDAAPLLARSRLFRWLLIGILGLLALSSVPNVFLSF